MGGGGETVRRGSSRVSGSGSKGVLGCDAVWGDGWLGGNRKRGWPCDCGASVRTKTCIGRLNWRLAGGNIAIGIWRRERLVESSDKRKITQHNRKNNYSNQYVTVVNWCGASHDWNRGCWRSRVCAGRWLQVTTHITLVPRVLSLRNGHRERRERRMKRTK